MRKLRFFQRLSAGLLPLCAALFGMVAYTAETFPDRYYATQPGDLPLHSGLFSSVATPLHEAQSTRAVMTDGENSEQASLLRLWGIFPVKEVTVRLTEQPTVLLGGTPFGIKLYTDGVLIVGLTEVDCIGGGSPAKAAGLRIGDTVLSVNGVSVSTNEEVAALISRSGGQTLTLCVCRDGISFEALLTPVRSEAEGTYKAGMWVRDSSAGIGTVTFYDEESGRLAGLGHAICDADTGAALPISGGELVPASIFGIVRGVSGQAGELRGCFESGTLGTLEANLSTGIFGTVRRPPSAAERIPLAMKQQVVTGPARVRTTLKGQTPDWYDLEITQIRYQDGSPTRNMVIRITDPRLLEQTGGIVQGMSGSPIVLIGQLVGAVTHVFVNDPTQGFAVFAEHMYLSMQALGTTDEAA